MLTIGLSYIRERNNMRKLNSYGERTVVRGCIDKRSLNSIIRIGHDCLIEGLIVTGKEGSEILIGNNVFIGGNSLIDCVDSIAIEDDVLISFGCLLADSDNHSLRYSIRKNDLRNWKAGQPNWSTANTKPIKISKGVWVGANSIILKGVTIGTGSIVGAGSVVTKSIPPWTVVAGNPARIIRNISKEER